MSQSGLPDVYSNLDDLERFVILFRLNFPNVAIVLTSGTFDIKHVGHDRYLNEAGKRGYLVVGIDGDEKVKQRKGESRPIVCEEERVESLQYHRAVGVIYVKQLTDTKWALIKAVSPDVLIISERSGYSDQDIQALSEFCGEVIKLESQAETSTSARIRDIVIGEIGPMIKDAEGIYEQLAAFVTKLKHIKGGT